MTTIEGRLTYDEREKRYLLNGAPVFSRLASLINTSIASDVTTDGRDYGQVRITVEVIVEDDDPDDRELTQSDRAFLIGGGPNA